jgi:hypothetical protein
MSAIGGQAQPILHEDLEQKTNGEVEVSVDTARVSPLRRAMLGSLAALTAFGLIGAVGHVAMKTRSDHSFVKDVRLLHLTKLNSMTDFKYISKKCEKAGFYGGFSFLHPSTYEDNRPKCNDDDRKLCTMVYQIDISMGGELLDGGYLEAQVGCLPNVCNAEDMEKEQKALFEASLADTSRESGLDLELVHAPKVHCEEADEEKTEQARVMMTLIPEYEHVSKRCEKALQTFGDPHKDGDCEEGTKQCFYTLQIDVKMNGEIVHGGEAETHQGCLPKQCKANDFEKDLKAQITKRLGAENASMRYEYSGKGFATDLVDGPLVTCHECQACCARLKEKKGWSSEKLCKHPKCNGCKECTSKCLSS